MRSRILFFLANLGLATLLVYEAIGAAPSASRGRVDEAAAARHIDDLVDAGLKQAGVEPYARTDDATFLRRAYLQINGAIPTGVQARRFLDSTAADKRAQLIDELLASPGYGSHFFNYWAELLRIKVKRSDAYALWIRKSLNDNKPYDQFVRELLTAAGHVQDSPAVGYFLRDVNMPLDNAANTAQIFLGTQIGCAQCHDHPFEAWTQKQFYQFAAFTHDINWRYAQKRVQGATAIVEARTDLSDAQKQGVRTTLVRSVYDVVSDDAAKNLTIPADYAYDDAKPGDPIVPTPLFEPPLQGEVSKSPRTVFADWLTSKENPRFTLVIANRLWKRAFGLGLIEPVDDITDSSTASNPELMTYLTQLMRDLDYDLKTYQRVLYNTAAWQRECQTQEHDPETPYAFPGPLLRRLSPEQVWDSVATLLVDDLNANLLPVPEGPDPIQPCLSIFSQSDEELAAEAIALRARFPNAPTNAKAARARNRNNGGLRRASDLGQGMPSDHFLYIFGRGDRDSIEDSNIEPAVTQALSLLNGRDVENVLDAKSALMRTVAGAGSPEERVELLFLGILSRRPTPEEQAAEVAVLRSNPAAAVDLAWILLNTHEFLYLR